MWLESLQPLLRPLAPIYGGVVALRGRLYDSGRLAQTALSVPVVSVGNLVVGGAGKTPVVALLAGWLRDRGLRVAILSRGYGRRRKGRVVVQDFERLRASVEQGGDEPVLLARELPGVAVVVDADRVAAGRMAVAELGANVLLLDDGFQHRRLGRDLDLLVLDATMDHERLRLLPIRGSVRGRRPVSGRQPVLGRRPVLRRRAAGRAGAPSRRLGGQ